MKSKNNKLRLLTLFFAGYGYIILLLIGLLAMFFLGVILTMQQARLGANVIRLLIPLAIFFIAIVKGFLKAAFAKIPAPKGIDIKEADAPEFFQLLQDIKVKAKCPKIHHVKFDLSFNAYVTEIPRLGIFGLYQKYLVIGVPLMLALSKEELTAVIAHELGHLSNSHSKLAVRVLRVSKIWERITEELKKSDRDQNIFIKSFIVRYIPALNDALLSTKRENEYVADQVAASITSPAIAATVLLKISVYSSFLDTFFWKRVNSIVSEQDRPPVAIFNDMEEFLTVQVPNDFKNFIISNELEYKSLPCWTHPSTAERLKKLGGEREIDITQSSALRSIFAKEAENVLLNANQLYKDYFAEQWKEQHDSFQELNNKLEEYENSKRNGYELTTDEQVDRALLLEKIKGTELGLEAFQKIHNKVPDSVPVKFHLGRLMLKMKNNEGSEILHSLVESDYQMIPHCCNVLYRYYYQIGDIDKATKYYFYAIEFMKTNNEVKDERKIVKFSDTYVPHDIAMKYIVDLRNKLLESNYVSKAYITRKWLKTSNQFPIYIILLKLKTKSKQRRLEILKELSDADLLPWNHLLVPIKGKNRKLELIFTYISNSRII